MGFNSQDTHIAPERLADALKCQTPKSPRLLRLTVNGLWLAYLFLGGASELVKEELGLAMPPRVGASRTSGPSTDLKKEGWMEQSASCIRR